uniref:Secreted protein n=1 Tax=Haemonchus contortus TaxID=6289 RepID=A0A7I5E9J7_HAECO
MVNQNRKGFPIHMDVFKVIAQIVLSTSVAVIAPCAREKKATTKPTRSAIVLKPSASSSAASRSSCTLIVDCTLTSRTNI